MALSFGGSAGEAAPAFAFGALAPIDVVCARCALPFFIALTDYALGPPPAAPPRAAHAHALVRTARSSSLYGGRGAVCSAPACGASIGDRPSYGCAPCDFDLCDACARPPVPRVSACLRTSANPLVGSLRAGARAAAWDCAACARPPAAHAEWTVDGGTGAVPLFGASLAVAIGEGEARIIAHAPVLPPPGGGLATLVGAGSAVGAGPGRGPTAGQPAGPSLSSSLAAMPMMWGVAGRPAWPTASARLATDALRASDLSFSLLCDKALGDLEDLGRGQRYCTDCGHTVTVAKSWGDYESLARAGRCIAALIVDPENASTIAAAAVRVSG